MAEILNLISTGIETVIEALGYPGIALVMFIENLFPPIPSEIVMPFAGFLVAGEGQLTFSGIVASGTLGSVLGAVALYWIGAWANEPVIRRFVRRYGRYMLLDESDLNRVLAVFDRYGEFIVFIGRLIPLIRSLISLPAGMQRMPFWRFLLFTVLGSLIWTALLSYAGFVLGENWEQVLELVDQYQLVTFSVIGVLLAAFIVRRVQTRLAAQR